jgi:hypothetical protein
MIAVCGIGIPSAVTEQRACTANQSAQAADHRGLRGRLEETPGALPLPDDAGHTKSTAPRDQQSRGDDLHSAQRPQPARGHAGERPPLRPGGDGRGQPLRRASVEGEEQRRFR